MNVLDRRLKKLEQENAISIDFDINRPLKAWSRTELTIYAKYMGWEITDQTEYLRSLSLDELREIDYEH